MALKSKSLDKVRPVPVSETALREEVVRINLNVPLSTRARWKAAAAAKNCSLADLIVEGVNTHLSK
jgi:hypothetical protein